MPTQPHICGHLFIDDGASTYRRVHRFIDALDAHAYIYIYISILGVSGPFIIYSNRLYQIHSLRRLPRVTPAIARRVAPIRPFPPLPQASAGIAKRSWLTNCFGCSPGLCPLRGAHGSRGHINRPSQSPLVFSARSWPILC